MKKQRITYGVYNIIEWHALIPMGKAVVKVTFTGGAITTQGITPATFTTSDPIVQFAIERSVYYHSGKIKVIRKTQLNEEFEIERNQPKHTAPAPAPTPTTLVKELLTQETKPMADATPVPTPSPEAETENEEAESTGTIATEEAMAEETEEANPDNMTLVEFDNNDDAKDYLVDTFGFVKSKLRNRDIIIAAGASKGVDIRFTD